MQKSIGSTTIWDVKSSIWHATQREKGILQLFFFFWRSSMLFKFEKGANFKIWPLALFWVSGNTTTECGVCTLIKVSYWWLVWIPGQAPDVTQPTAWRVTLNYNLKLPSLEVIFPSQLNNLIHTGESVSALMLFSFIYQKMVLRYSAGHFLRVTPKSPG